MNGEVSVIDQLLDILGKDDMRRFLSSFGGRDFKFPKAAHSPAAQAIASVVGEEKAADLIDAFCGVQVYVPKHPDASDRDAPYLRLMADGLTNTEISSRLGVAERSVRRALARCGVKNQNNDPGNARKRAARQAAQRPADGPSAPVSTPHTRKPEMAS